MPIDIIKPFLELLEKEAGKPAALNGAITLPVANDASLPL
jgi:hypothetical protein